MRPGLLDLAFPYYRAGIFGGGVIFTSRGHSNGPAVERGRWWNLDCLALWLGDVDIVRVGRVCLDMGFNLNMSC